MLRYDWIMLAFLGLLLLGACANMVNLASNRPIPCWGDEQPKPYGCVAEPPGASRL